MSVPLSTPAFNLGTFSIAGCPPFAGLVAGNRVIALDAVKKVADAQGLPVTGTGSVLALLQNWESNFSSLAKAVTLVDANDPAWAPVDALHVHAPVDLPRQIFCTGANYFKHVVDLIVDLGAGATPGTEKMTPEELRTFAENLMTERSRTGFPYVFSKVPSAVTGPFDPVILPAISHKPDWELELAVIIGKPARHVRREDALSYIAGYSIANDITSRDLIWCTKDNKAMGTDWISSKNSPTFLPFGPYLVPAAFVPKPQDLRITLKLNGKTMQDESTSDMIFDIARQIEYISSRVQLWPGDVICTGSPAGNGTHYKRFLQEGDVMEGSITGLGMQRNPCVKEPTPGVNTA
ncbi:fumarylacetoacetate hydrolase family protein [Noviherbaspirillum sp. Root189]|uniref:fumarylacetoacetate hydrolase family protein n=1 Tax=Noviherbaspirillum sp. Root189 TaxID=1736487 RepID=UPI00070B0291|nr:fumarylacetoacetate hydrolase family protein [Noviherbaspirillum sp. Root189]KRB93540.1 5-carboxymethyl-2-hydroxymuconate isomerase [Noviherbaspirillum sp. Root189]